MRLARLQFCARRSPSVSSHATDPRGFLIALGQPLQVDSELLAFFVKMAALQSQNPCSLGDVAVIAIELRQHGGAFEGKHALSQ